MPHRYSLAARLAPFVEAGLVTRIPTAAQVRQGELQMLPYVISSDATSEECYAGTPLGHPVVRQPVLLGLIGRDHLETGTGLAAALDSVIRHLHFTYHQGMPVWDLQVIQTHEGGLDALRAETEALLAPRTRVHRARRRLLGWIVADPDAYLRLFLGEDGYIARAARFDYPKPSEEDAEFPPEFFSLVDFVNYCAVAFPEQVPLHLVPQRALAVVSRRFREGKRIEWLEADPRVVALRKAAARDGRASAAPFAARV
ncbi:MAG: hypothetical protein H6726_05565 [Sandaracinaceae bacterium]|nr:hypothetical protein [Myxococcales bacterium]MCB9657103.1 hypothetical protein [Sandaracinaceae bacterium]